MKIIFTTLLALIGLNVYSQTKVNAKVTKMNQPIKTVLPYSLNDLQKWAVMSQMEFDKLNIKDVKNCEISKNEEIVQLLFYNYNLFMSYVNEMKLGNRLWVDAGKCLYIQKISDEDNNPLKDDDGRQIWGIFIMKQ